MSDMFENFDDAYGAGYHSGLEAHDVGIDALHPNRHGLTLPNGEGGFDHYDSNMHMTAHTIPNVHGGFDIHDSNMHMKAHIMPNAHDGADIYDSNMHVKAHTMPNTEGGFDFYDSDMHMTGSLMPNISGGVDYLSMHGNADTMLNYQDPLVHSAEYHMNPFNVGAFR